MGLTAAFRGVDPSGVARFDASSMVAWREKQTLERMKLEETQRAQVCVVLSWRFIYVLCMRASLHPSTVCALSSPF